MYKIVDNKKEAKKYTEGVNTLFRLYRLKAELDEKEEDKKEFLKIINAVISGELYSSEPVKKEIILTHHIKGLPLTEVSKKFSFSSSYIYRLNESVIKELAMLIFKILIL